jgi:ATP-binding cassette subfamily C protein
MPIYLLICFAFHVWIGIAALAGAMVLVNLTLLTEALTRKPMKATTQFAAVRNGFAETSRRNAEVMTALGMIRRMRDRWYDANGQYIASNRKASDVAGHKTGWCCNWRCTLSVG